MKKQLLTLIALFASNILFAQVPSYVPTSGLLAWYNFNGNGANANNASLELNNNNNNKNKFSCFKSIELYFRSCFRSCFNNYLHRS
jgi:hypothetical protein